PPGPVVEHLAGLLDDLALAFDVVDVALEADVAEPLASMVERQALALGERGGHRLDAVVKDTVEDAVLADGDREVREAADVAVDRRERVGVRQWHSAVDAVCGRDRKARAVGGRILKCGLLAG